MQLTELLILKPPCEARPRLLATQRFGILHHSPPWVRDKAYAIGILVARSFTSGDSRVARLAITTTANFTSFACLSISFQVEISRGGVDRIACRTEIVRLLAICLVSI